MSHEGEEGKKAIEDVFKSQVDSLLSEYQEKIRTYKQDAYINPILSIVGILPKEELAEMADSLVSLTSLKRRVSTDDETVGGPTDVALITKGDGLIWIKRKHYFDPALNTDFFNRKSK